MNRDKIGTQTCYLHQHTFVGVAIYISTYLCWYIDVYSMYICVPIFMQCITPFTCKKMENFNMKKMLIEIFKLHIQFLYTGNSSHILHLDITKVKST